MKTTNGTNGKALAAALDRDSYEWLAVNRPDIAMAIDTELRNGMEPEGIRFVVQRHVGADREGLALRCEQAARHIAKGRAE